MVSVSGDAVEVGPESRHVGMSRLATLTACSQQGKALVHFRSISDRVHSSLLSAPSLAPRSTSAPASRRARDERLVGTANLTRSPDATHHGQGVFAATAAPNVSEEEE